MAHGNEHAVLTAAKLDVVARTKRRNLLILVAGGLSMIEYHIVHQVDDNILANARARVRVQLDAKIAGQRVVGNFDDAGDADGARRAVPIIIVIATNDGAVRLRFVCRGQLNRENRTSSVKGRSRAIE
jgi:hypothetical protein